METNDFEYNGDETLRIFGLVPDSIVDGPGLRYAIFVQGCAHACKDCHNPESWAFSGGDVLTIDTIYKDIRADKGVKSVTFSGGDPMYQAEACAKLASRLKSEGYDIWTYTGFLWEDLLSEADPARMELLRLSNVVVDGPFENALRSLDLEFCGSSNQRVIDVQKSLADGKVHKWSRPQIELHTPSNW
jgi:anaerobic ribonucleoside-triphosphate reductase activating protein